MAEFVASDSPNRRWADSARGRRITVVRDGFIGPKTGIFAIGSCFAVELRRALRERGRKVYPDYAGLDFDPAEEAPGMVPERDNINHYDTFTIRQEIERAVAGADWDPSIFRRVEQYELKGRKRWPFAWQDPTRRHVYATSYEALVRLSAKVSRCIDEGLARADVVLISLGITEAWRIRGTDLYACMGPRDRQDERFASLEFVPSGFVENHANLKAALQALWRRYPGKKVVLTVSPVALGSTWRDEDVVVASLYGKATLRSVAGAICEEFPQVSYWPSFEFGMADDIFKEDGRHVRLDEIEGIVDAFLETYRA